MKNCLRVVFAVVLLLSLANSMVRSEGEYGMTKPVKVSRNYQIVQFEGITYSVYTQGNYELIFSSYNAEKVKLNVLPCYIQYMEYPPVYMQWGYFSIVELIIGGDEGDSFLLGTETGYAEK